MAKQKVLLSRSKDKSLEAFKAWITEFTKHLLGREPDFSEEKWVEFWKRFWGD